MSVPNFSCCAGRLAYPIHANSSAQHKVEQDFFEGGKTSFWMDGSREGGREGDGRQTDTMGGKGRRRKESETGPQPNIELCQSDRHVVCSTLA